MYRMSRVHTANGSYSLPSSSGEPPFAEMVYSTPSLLHKIRLPSGDHAGANSQAWSDKTIGDPPAPIRIFTSLLGGHFVSTQLKTIHFPSGDQDPPYKPLKSPNCAGAPPFTGEIQTRPDPSGLSAV